MPYSCFARPFAALCALLLSTSLFAGCGTVQSSSDPSASATGAAADRSANLVLCAEGRLSGLTPVRTLSASAAQSNARLSAALCTQLYKKADNLFVSPLSVQLALGMITHGARGDTQKQLLQALSAPDAATLNQSCRDLQSLLTGSDTSPIRLANGIWVRDSAADTLLPSFVRDNAAYYGARLTAAPFDNTLLPVINTWVSDHTDGRIRELLREPLSPNMAMILINTLLFSGQWANPFAASDATMTFHGAQGDITLPKLSQTLFDAAWYEDDTTRLTALPYADGRTVMLLAQPTGGMDAWMAQLDADRLQALTQAATGTQTACVALTLPSFQLSYRALLDDTLKAVGVTAAFDEATADFTGIDNGKNGLFVEKVIHQTSLEVTREGTVAAAATAVLMAGRGGLPDDMKELTLDRPFFCAIVDKPTGAILFAGAVNAPEART